MTATSDLMFHAPAPSSVGAAGAIATRSNAAMLGVLLLSVMLGGCSFPTLTAPGGELRISSQAAGALSHRFNFTTGVYSYDDTNTLTVVLFDGPQDHPSAALTVRMFWQPRAAATPIDPSATNSTVHFVVFGQDGDDKQLAVYSGAGFMYPYSNVGDEKMRGGVWEATLRLADASPNFIDTFGQAMIQGDFTARRDAAATERSLHRLRVLVQEGLGYPRLVMRQ